MARHNELGKEGEALAIEFLKKNSYEILHSNWRHSHLELDIIAKKNSVLHFVEVKSRQYYPGAFPEESITKKKFNFLKKAAEEYLFHHPEYQHVQFDVLAITIFNDRSPELFLIEDVFL